MNMSTEPNAVLTANISGTGQKIFIHRDYSQGTGIRFSNKFPQELDGLIPNSTYISFIEELNSKYAEAERTTFAVVLNNCFACVTLFTCCCCSTPYENQTKNISNFIQQQNDQKFKPRGVQVIDPMDRGMRVLEIIIKTPSRHS